MPPRKTQAAQGPDTKKAMATQGGGEEPARFTTGAGVLADDMAVNGEQAAEDAARIRAEADAAARSQVAAQGVRLQKLDSDGQAVGEPQHLPGVATVSLGAENPQVAPVPDGNLSTEFEITDPAAVELIRQATRIPIPTAVVCKWWPAFFRPPGEPQPWVTCKVFLTPQGLYVYRSAPEPETYETGATPAWYSPVDFAKTAKPVTGYAALNAGVPITTAAGRVNVQPSPGCGCAAGKLKRWTPTWARNTISWEDAVALTTTTDTTAGR